MVEVWKDIKGYEGLYEVSNLGKVRSLRNNIILTQSFCKDKYLKVKLCNVRQRTIQVHRLVAAAFITNKDDNKTQVNHIDGNKIITMRTIWNGLHQKKMLDTQLKQVL